MKAYSHDLRERIVRAVDAGMPKAEAARTFDVALSTVKLYVARRQQTGSLAARTSPGRPRAIPPSSDAALQAQLRAHFDWTVAQHAVLWEQEHQVTVGVDAMRRAIRRLDWRFKKKSLVATERDDARRQCWRQDTHHLDARRFVVVDETSTSIALTRHYAWAPKSERARGSIPRNHGVPTTLVASLTPDGLGPAMTRQGPIDTAAFVAYVEHVLGPHLEPGQIVLLDNLSAHKAERVRSLIAERHCQLLYLSPYSPDFSPIEFAFSKLKDSLRQAAARTQEALDEAIRSALDQITPQDARHFFSHCDYHLPAES